MRLLWLLLPDDAFLALTCVGVGLGLIVGLVRPRVAFSILGMAILIVMMAPLIEEFISGLPAWVGLLLLIGISFAIVRLVFALLIGRQATSHMVGQLAAVSVVFVLALPFRIMAALFRALLRAGR